MTGISQAEPACMSEEDAARARLLFHYEGKGREFHERMERLRVSVTEVADEAVRRSINQQLARLTAAAEDNRNKADRLRGLWPDLTTA